MIRRVHFLVIIALSLSSVSVFYLAIITGEAAAAKEGILLTLGNSSFTPLSTVHGNQVLVSVKYQVNAQSFKSEKINGIMKLYTSNGTLIHSSSFPDGFAAKKKRGEQEFKTTIRDPEIQSLTANVTFTDLKKTETISNVVSAKLQLKKSSAAALADD